MRARALAAAAALLALAAPRPARAYRWDQHYITVRLAYEAREGGAVAALCGQLADEAPELNAIEVYRRLMRHPLDYAAWTLGGRGPEATVGRMVTIQQMLHGLTGGSPEAVRAVAAAAARELAGVARSEADPQRRADAQCAVGFALHLYGDSFSHARIKNPSKTYDTGIGHFYDSSKPDQPLSSPARLKMWRRYMESARELLFGAVPASWRALFAAAEAAQPRARSGNGFAHDELLAAERAALSAQGIDAAPFKHNAGNAPCQTVVDEAAAGLPRAPDCEAAWTLYRTVAERAFKDYDADPARAAAPSRGPVRRPFSSKSPFAQGVAR